MEIQASPDSFIQVLQARLNEANNRAMVLEAALLDQQKLNEQLLAKVSEDLQPSLFVKE